MASHGTGIMGVNLAGGNLATALLANGVATGLILHVLITILGPISGAHLNPVVTLVFAILGGQRHARGQVPALVAARIGGAYWFTGSSCFPNPAVTVARAFTDTFTGILLADAPAFVLAQLAAALTAAITLPKLFS